jgi:hypothetical protein
MSMLSRTITSSAGPLKSNGGLNHAFRQIRSVQSTTTSFKNTTAMSSGSESLQEDPGYVEFLVTMR